MYLLHCLTSVTFLSNFLALQNIELASFLRWYVAVELHDHVYAKRFYSTYELLEENIIKVWT